MRILLVCLAVAARAVVADAAGETIIRDLKNTKIIRSQESPHNILNEACVACHPKDKFDFWLLIYKGNPPNVSVENFDEKGKPKGEAAEAAAAATPTNRYNSHETISCNLCHFDNPTAETPKFIVDVRTLCTMCHPGVEPHRLPAGENAARVEAAVASGKLPGLEGKIFCTTCHKVHDSTYGMRDAYAAVLWEGTVPNPHGNRALCFTCHPGRIKEGAEVKLLGDGDSVRLCNECHAKAGVKKEPHPVGVGASEGTWRMEYLGYPLDQGKLVCATCHAEASHGKPDRANPKFLRGGPYDQKDQFCFRCHLEDKEAANNPHRQVDGFGRIREDSCRFCHKEVPDPNKPSARRVEMVGDETAICAGCHALKPHPDVDHIRPITKEALGRKEEYERRHKVKLPLAGSGVMTCTTCHNPHGKGVLKLEAGVGAGSKYRVPDFREVCAPCHGRY